jgi:hypothetical protein
MVFQNRMLKRIFGPVREEVTGGWITLHKEELCNLYSLPNITWVIVGHVAHMEEMMHSKF